MFILCPKKITLTKTSLGQPAFLATFTQNLYISFIMILSRILTKFLNHPSNPIFVFSNKLINLDPHLSLFFPQQSILFTPHILFKHLIFIKYILYLFRRFNIHVSCPYNTEGTNILKHTKFFCNINNHPLLYMYSLTPQTLLIYFQAPGSRLHLLSHPSPNT